MEHRIFQTDLGTFHRFIVDEGSVIVHIDPSGEEGEIGFVSIYDRDLVTRRTGKATWDIYINPGARRFAGKPYVVAASLSGAWPATRFPGGREGTGFLHRWRF